ncbi:hypothetical protein F0562_035234 [Nyssa sinensis]|uniref:TMV resistance protein N n=1 Tax=Nyssa sinensis TaxID=561372 RepID=A0A5J5AEN4_9ASTE|nr:hypothetical protein F0562_035234 [Nyssa sinensis]
MDKDCAVNILNGCDFFAEYRISILTSRCLLTINEKNELRMHDLLRDMGREIIREESTKEPGKRSRLWFHEDVCDVLENQKGTETIQGVTLVLPTSNEVHLNTKAFARMHKLRLLQIKCVHLTGSYEFLSKELRWLYWHNCPLRYLPSNFHLENLVVLDMQHSNVKKVWQDIKKLSDQYESCICLPLKEIPDWFSYQRMGSSISFDMPLHADHQFLGMTLWVVYAAVEDRDEWFIPPSVAISDRTNGVDWTYKPTTTAIQVTCQEHSWVSHIPKSYFRYPFKGGERMAAWINMEEPFEVKKCGFHLVYKPDITRDDQGQSSRVNTDGQDELVDIMHPKRGRDVSVVETSYDWFKEDQVPKRSRMEPDQTKDSNTELDQLKK